MKKMNFIQSFIILSLMASFSFSQKLPNKQEVGVRIPSNLKIDGLANEWTNKYQAYNNGTQIYYTIANDNDNLYLIIHAVKSQIIEKIMEGGVSFTVTSSDKIDEDRDFTVLFPLLKIADCRDVLRTAGKTLSEGSSFGPLPNTDTTKIVRVVSIPNANELLHNHLKEIKIAGTTSVTDTVPGLTPKTPYYSFLPLRFHNFKVIKLANRDGITAFAKFDDQGALSCEILFPLKLAKLSMGNTPKIAYKITLNARGEDGRPGNSIWYTHTKPQEMMYMDLETETDFSSQYTLAKKQ